MSAKRSGPAFRTLDIHTHGLGAYDTNTERPEDILKLAALHRKRGTEFIVPAIYPAPVSTMRRRMQNVREAMRKDGGGCIKGLYLEGPFLNPLFAGALDGRSFLNPSVKTFMSLIESFEDIIRVITVAPELPGALRVIERSAGLGITVSMGHSDATYKEAVRGMEAGARGVTHLFNAMRPMHHREGGLASAGLLEPGLYVEVIADGIHLAPETLRLVFAIKNSRRIVLVSDAVKGAGRGGKGGNGGRGGLYKGGVLQGGGLTLAECAGRLIELGIPPGKISAALWQNPRRYLGMRIK